MSAAAQPCAPDGRPMTQREIQIWNDAVAACRQAAMTAVDQMEAEAADGMPNPARIVVRNVSNQLMPGDERRVLPQDMQDRLLEAFGRINTTPSEESKTDE